MPDTARQIHTISTNEARNIAVSFVGKLDGTEVLTGSPTVTEVDAGSPNALAITSKAVSTIELTINGATVPIGQAIQFKIDGSGATVGNTYLVDIVCDTDASQTIDGRIQITIN